MTVLERSELEASSLADLHEIANQVGIDGFRRLRKAELIDAILGLKAQEEEEPAAEGEVTAEEPARAEEPEAIQEGTTDEEEPPAETPRRRRFGRLRRVVAPAEEEAAPETVVSPETALEEPVAESQVAEAEPPAEGEQPAETVTRSSRSRAGSRSSGATPRSPADLIEGVVELASNGSAFLRVEPEGPDVYISAAQVRRCELVGGDRVAGPVRQPRRSERYPSLVRVDTVNGVPASTSAVSPRYDEQPAVFPSELLRFDSEDVTLMAIERLTPIGLGSRAIIVGPSQSGKTEALGRLVRALAGRDDLEIILVLAGVRPEETADWTDGPLVPAAALTFAATPEAQAQAVEQAIERGKRIAARGGNAVVAIDSLDGLPAGAARKAMAAARKLAQAGSLTVIATASQPLGGETTVIALDLGMTATGRLPAIDLTRSGTIRAEALVGEEGARAIHSARAGAVR